MDFAIYAAYLGMRARQQRLDVIANNIANASTAGFKAHRLNYRSVAAAEQEPASGAAPGAANNSSADSPTTNPTAANRARSEVGVLTGESTDFSAGPIRETGRSLDIALDGDAFLVVQTSRGQRFTRQGSLTLDSSGQLVTQNGDLVVGDGGPITVPPGEISIAEDGTISANGKSAGRLKLVHFADANASLTREGNSLFAALRPNAAEDTTNTKVVQGALEMSNVSSMTEMVAMMQNSREFESLQRTVSTLMNDLGRKVANEIAKL